MESYRAVRWRGVLVAALSACLLVPALLAGNPRVIEILADKDDRFKIPGDQKSIIVVKANEVIRLRITARRGAEWDKDGSVHGFTIKALKDRGWDLRLKEGVNEHTLVAPSEPGDYVVECTVKCGEGHDDMRMTLRVIP